MLVTHLTQYIDCPQAALLTMINKTIILMMPITDLWEKFVNSKFISSYSINYWDICDADTLAGYTHVKIYLVSDFFVSTLVVLYACLMLFIMINSSQDARFRFVVLNKLARCVAFVMREVEKEMINMEDMIFVGILFLVVVGWFFLFCVLPFYRYELVFSAVLIIFPIMFLLTMFLPFGILFDQGFFFIVYLRGVASTTVFCFEIIFDIIAIIILFSRIIIQNARIFVMFFVFFELEEFITLYNVDLNITPYFYSAPIYDKHVGFIIIPSTIAWFVISQLPMIIILCIYNLIHLLFIFSMYTYIFFFLVFWLYLILYSFFYTQKFEIFFKNRREFYRRKYNK